MIVLGWALTVNCLREHRLLFTTIVSLSVILLAVVGLARCSQRPQQMPAGYIVTNWHQSVYRIDLQADRVDTLVAPDGWEVFDVMSKLSDSQAMVCNTRAAVALATTQSEALILIRPPQGSDTRCYALDYDPIAKEYLLSGAFEGVRGCIILDSQWNVINVVHSDTADWSQAGYGFFLEGRRIALYASGHLHIVDRYSGDYQTIPYAMGLGVSPDRRSLVVYNTVDGGHYLLNVSTGDSLALPKAADVSDFAFSPDGRYVAYRTITGLTDLSRLWIYDLVERKSIETRFVNVGSLVWLHR